MNKYLMCITGYFSGKEEFKIDAEDKADAIKKATEYCKHNPKYSGGNYMLDSIKCVKKLK